jgi:hypothetical protein
MATSSPKYELVPDAGKTGTALITGGVVSGVGVGVG